MGILPQIWRIYLSLPTPLAKQYTEQRKLQKDYLAVRHDLNATSSQDEFAKWAKLRRQHDKLLEELEKKSTQYPSKALHTPIWSVLLTIMFLQNPASKPRAKPSTAT